MAVAAMTISVPSVESAPISSQFNVASTEREDRRIRRSSPLPVACVPALLAARRSGLGGLGRWRLERLTDLAENRLTFHRVEQDVIADLEVAMQQLFGERVFDQPPDRAPQRPRTERRIPTFLGDQLARRFGGFQRHVLVLQLLDDLGEFERDDQLDLLQ